MRWRGRVRSWTGRWPGRGPFNYLSPWRRPGWLYGYGRGLGYGYWEANYNPWVGQRLPWLPRRWWASPRYGYGAPYTRGYPSYRYLQLPYP